MNTTVAAIHPQILTPKTAQVLQTLGQVKSNFLSPFYLSGGTALALQLGHRESEDLDFFSESTFRPDALERLLSEHGTLSETELLPGTINTYLNGVKLQFLHYPYRLIEPICSWNAVRISSVIDVACTKLQTVGMRGSKKDFIDLYFLLKKYTLPELFSYSKQKYVESDYSETFILKSLVYFNDAEQQPMPRMHQDVSWDQVKQFLSLTVKSYFEFVTQN